MPEYFLPIVLGIGIFAFIVIAMLIMIARFYRKVDQGRALIINKTGEKTIVTFSGGVVVPIFHRAEIMDISVKTIEIDRRGEEGLICKDNIRADIKVNFFVRVNKTENDVLRVAQSIGCDRASNQSTINELFSAKFSEALKTVGKRLDFEQLYTQRDDFKDQIIEVIGKDLNGYVLEDAAIDFLEQTPLSSLDEHNILDSQGIRKITDLTTQSNVRTNELRQKERMEIGSQNLAADEAVFRFEQQRAEAEAKKDKEISIAQTREQNEAARLKYEEVKQTSLKQQKVEEEVKLAEEAKVRAIAVAEQARLREIGVEKVRVKKATDLEQVDLEREVSLRAIDKEKALEIEKKEIAEVMRTRISVEKNVAEEEENIKDLRAGAEARREKDVLIVAAEAEAQEGLLKSVKQAEAAEEVAKFEARKQLTLAEAALEAADKNARAKVREAEGIQAQAAAPGLADVRVKEAEAVAIEKKGLAEVKVREAAVNTSEREGLVEAQVIKEKHLAEASGIEQRGLAGIKVREAEAQAVEKMGHAEATAAREKLLAEVAAKEAMAQAVEKNMVAEAEGLRQKAAAMAAFDHDTREHENFRLRLEKELELALKGLDTRVAIADKQAAVLGSAFDQANINIVGGDGAFFERFIKAVSVGQSIDGAIGNSRALSGILQSRIDGDEDLIDDVKEMVAGVSSESLRDVTLSAVLSKLLLGADDAGERSKISALMDQARALGLVSGPAGGQGTRGDGSGEQ